MLKSAGLSQGYVATMNGRDDIPKYNRLSKEPSRKMRTFTHSGVFEFSRTDDANDDSDLEGDVGAGGDAGASEFAENENGGEKGNGGGRVNAGLKMWTDTGSYDQHSVGDVVRVRDPFASNFASPNSS